MEARALPSATSPYASGASLDAVGSTIFLPPGDSELEGPPVSDTLTTTGRADCSAADAPSCTTSMSALPLLVSTLEVAAADIGRESAVAVTVDVVAGAPAAKAVTGVVCDGGPMDGRAGDGSFGASGSATTTKPGGSRGSVVAVGGAVDGV